MGGQPSLTRSGPKSLRIVWERRRESGESGECGENGDFGGSAKLELRLIDAQGLDPMVKGRGWNFEFGCRARRSSDPASALGQRGLDDLPFTSERGRGGGYLRSSSNWLRGQPGLVDGEDIVGRQNDGTLDHVL